jgi:glycosyltransferase involved in cell wall biosynthesis
MSVTTASRDFGHERAAAPRRLAGLSVVLPCHDEEDNLPQVLEEWRAACRANAASWELVVVDDGSTDATARIATDALRRWSDVRLVMHGRNLGYGTAVRSGLCAAREPWTLVTDGDGQFDPADLRRLVAETDTHDVVVGYRVRRADGPVRRLNGRAWTALMRALLDLPVRDVDCAFKLLRTELIDKVSFESTGAMVSAELLARVLRSGARLAEVPVAHRPRTAGTASGAHPAVIGRAFRELLAVRRSLPRGPETAR